MILKVFFSIPIILGLLKLLSFYAECHKIVGVLLALLCIWLVAFAMLTLVLIWTL